MADDAIDEARAQRDAADRTLAQYNLDLLTEARTLLAAFADSRARLKAISQQLDASNGSSSLGLLSEMLGSVDLTLQGEQDVHQRTLTRLAAE